MLPSLISCDFIPSGELQSAREEFKRKMCHHVDHVDHVTIKDEKKAISCSNTVEGATRMKSVTVFCTNKYQSVFLYLYYKKSKFP